MFNVSKCWLCFIVEILIWHNGDKKYWEEGGLRDWREGFPDSVEGDTYGQGQNSGEDPDPSLSAHRSKY